MPRPRRTERSLRAVPQARGLSDPAALSRPGYSRLLHASLLHATRHRTLTRYIRSADLCHQKITAAQRLGAADKARKQRSIALTEVCVTALPSSPPGHPPGLLSE